MLVLSLGLFIVSSLFGFGLFKLNHTKKVFRSHRKHSKPLVLDKNLAV